MAASTRTLSIAFAILFLAFAAPTAATGSLARRAMNRTSSSSSCRVHPRSEGWTLSRLEYSVDDDEPQSAPRRFGGRPIPRGPEAHQAARALTASGAIGIGGIDPANGLEDLQIGDEKIYGRDVRAILIRTHSVESPFVITVLRDSKKRRRSRSCDQAEETRVDYGPDLAYFNDDQLLEQRGTQIDRDLAADFDDTDYSPSLVCEYVKASHRHPGAALEVHGRSLAQPLADRNGRTPG